MVASKTGSDDLKPDISEEDLKRLYARASAQRFDENPRYPQHTSGGVVPMEIKGRFANERERLGPDFDETQRQWRIKWITDQRLHPNEPFDVKQLYLEYYNPIRRFYRKPMDMFEAWLRQRTDRKTAMTTRKLMATAGIAYLSMLGIWYYLRFNRESWEKLKGARIIMQKENVYPGDPRFPMETIRTEKWQFWDRGFHDRKVFKD